MSEQLAKSVGQVVDSTISYLGDCKGKPICDARTVKPEDRVWSDCVIDPPGAPELRFENSVFRYNPDHRWCYFRGMNRDEVLVFKGYDSDPARATGAPHSAFDDPSAPPDAPPRASIDVRAFAFFD